MLMILIIVIVVIVMTNHDKKNGIGPATQLGYNPNIYQNVAQVQALEARNAELNANLASQLDQDEPDLEAMKAIKAEINNNKAEIERLKQEDINRAAQSEQELVVKAEQQKNNSGAVVLYIGGLLLIAGFCGIFARETASAFGICLLMALVFVILGITFRVSGNERMSSLSNSSFYVVMTLMPFIASLFCEMSKIGSYGEAAVTMLIIFAVYAVISVFVKTKLAAALTVIASVIFAQNFFGLFGIDASKVTAFGAVVMLIYGAVAAIFTNSKILPERYLGALKVAEVFVIVVNILVSSTAIGSFALEARSMHRVYTTVSTGLGQIAPTAPRSILANPEFWCYALASIGSLIHLFVSAIKTKRKGYEISGRIAGYFVITPFVIALINGLTYVESGHDLMIASCVVAGISVVLALASLAKGINKQFADDKALRSFLSSEISLYTAFSIVFTLSALGFDNITRSAMAAFSTLFIFIGFSLVKKYQAQAAEGYKNGAKELLIYSFSYSAIVVANTIINLLIDNKTNGDTELFKAVLSMHIACVPLIVYGVTSRKMSREVIGVVGLSVVMGTIAIIDYFSHLRHGVPIYTLLYVTEAVAATIVGFIVQNRIWLRVVGIISIISIIVTYTSEFMLYWFLLFGVALVALAIYLVVRPPRNQNPPQIPTAPQQ